MLQSKKLTAKAELALRKRYEYPEWAFFTEIGGERGRSADAVAINVWPSRKYVVHGFEIKATRADWLKELRTPSKADFFVGQCDSWFIVAAKPGIVKDGELPDGWGLIELRKNRLFTKVGPGGTFKPTPSRRFYTNLIRQAFEKNDVSRRVIYEAEQKGFGRSKEEAKKEAGYELNSMKADMRVIKKFKALGIDLWFYNDKEIKKYAKLIRIAKALSEEGLIGELERIRDISERMLNNSKKYIEELKSAKMGGKA